MILVDFILTCMSLKTVHMQLRGDNVLYEQQMFSALIQSFNVCRI